MDSRPYTNRIHSMDNLRAHLMLLGIVFHCALNYVTVPSELNFWYYADTQQHFIFDLITQVIHIFRMPLFFLVAGFFTALLIRKIGRPAFINDRIKRIVIPFIAFLPILFFTCQLIFNSFPVFRTEMTAHFKFFVSDPEDFDLIHLWFLFYLSFCYSFLVALIYLLDRFFNLNSVVQGLPALWQGAGIFIWPALTTAIILMNGSLHIESQIRPLVEPQLFLFYFIFFLAGFTYFHSDLIARQPKSLNLAISWVSSLLLFLLVSVGSQYYLSLPEEQRLLVFVLCASLLSVFVWQLSLTVLNTYKKFFSFSSPSLKYAADASYWVYLIHFPLCLLIPATLAHLDISAIGKFSISVVLITVICFSSYEWLVRYTFVGAFLSGKQRVRANSVIVEPLQVQSVEH